MLLSDASTLYGRHVCPEVSTWSRQIWVLTILIAVRGQCVQHCLCKILATSLFPAPQLRLITDNCHVLTDSLTIAAAGSYDRTYTVPQDFLKLPATAPQSPALASALHSANCNACDLHSLSTLESVVATIVGCMAPASFHESCALDPRSRTMLAESTIPHATAKTKHKNFIELIIN